MNIDILTDIANRYVDGQLSEAQAKALLGGE